MHQRGEWPALHPDLGPWGIRRNLNRRENRMRRWFPTADVVVMNPPFGALSAGVKDQLGKAYPRGKNDLLAIFVERGLEVLRPGGRIGAITSRTCFFLSSFQKWREQVGEACEELRGSGGGHGAG